jgi:hypothetical protein
VLETKTWVYIGRQGAEMAEKLAGASAGENGGKNWRERMGGRAGREKGKKDVCYADGAPRHRLDN